MANAFALGQKVSYDTDFYPQPTWAKGTGRVSRFESCGLNHKCTCGVGGTYFIRLDTEDTVVAYVATELAAI